MLLLDWASLYATFALVNKIQWSNINETMLKLLCMCKSQSYIDYNKENNLLILEAVSILFELHFPENQINETETPVYHRKKPRNAYSKYGIPFIIIPHQNQAPQRILEFTLQIGQRDFISYFWSQKTYTDRM